MGGGGMKRCRPSRQLSPRSIEEANFGVKRISLGSKVDSIQQPMDRRGENASMAANASAAGDAKRATERPPPTSRSEELTILAGARSTATQPASVPTKTGLTRRYSTRSATSSEPTIPVLGRCRDNLTIGEIIPGVLTAMLEREAFYSPDPCYISRHPSLTFRMRSILLDWMMEVSQEYMLKRETLQYSINFVDRFLSQEHDVQKNVLQLIGVTALFIAAKVEEIYPPQAKDFAVTTDGAFTAAQILDMERKMLQKLQWSLCPITPYAWLNYFVHQLNSPILEGEISSNKCGYPISNFDQALLLKSIEVVDFTLLCYQSLHFRPSVLAAAALLQCTPSWMHPTILEIAALSPSCQSLHVCSSWLELYTGALPAIPGIEEKMRQLSKDLPKRDWYSLQVYNAGALSYLKTFNDMPLPSADGCLDTTDEYFDSDTELSEEDTAQSPTSFSSVLSSEMGSKLFEVSLAVQSEKAATAAFFDPQQSCGLDIPCTATRAADLDDLEAAEEL